MAKKIKKEKIDILNDRGYKIIQDENLYCFNMDAVLISDFAKAKKNDEVLDIGCGNAVIPLLMHDRYEPKKIVGMEITSQSAELAKRSVQMNGLEQQISIINDDVKNIGNYFKPSHFDVIVSNPPYMEAGLKPKNSEVTVARHETKITFDEIASIVSKYLKVGKAFYLVHRSYRLVDVISTLRKYNLEPKEIRFVKPYRDRESNIFLLKAVRGGKPYLKVLSELIVYEDIGVYSEEINRIYQM